MPRMIYVIEFTTGEWSDRAETPLFAVRSETAAQEYVAVADRWLRDNNLHFDSPVGCHDLRDREARTRAFPFTPVPFDLPSVNYTGARFSYVAVPVVPEGNERLKSIRALSI